MQIVQIQMDLIIALAIMDMKAMDSIALVIIRSIVGFEFHHQKGVPSSEY